MNENIYRKMYTLLFNQITDALNDMENANWGSAKEILLSAQLSAEALYIDYAVPEENSSDSM